MKFQTVTDEITEVLKDAYNSETEKYEPTPHHKAPCGKTERADYRTLHDFEIIHKNCQVCRIMTGKSKALVIRTQDDLARLWTLGYMGKFTEDVYRRFEGIRTPRGNLYVSNEGKALTHYSTLSAIRTTRGDIITNSQDWSAGFATVPHIPGAVGRLPLTSLRGELIKIYDIEILDTDSPQWARTTLFKTGERFYLSGWDNQGFITELIEPVQTIAEAFETMKPLIVKGAEAGGLDVQRQGDLFFIHLPNVENHQVRNIQKAHYENQQHKPYWAKDTDPWIDLRVYVKPEIVIGEEKTRHLTNRVGEYLQFSPSGLYLGLVPVVKGNVTHPEHRTLKLGLKQWYRVIKNQVVRNLTITSPRGGMGAD